MHPLAEREKDEAISSFASLVLGSGISEITQAAAAKARLHGEEPVLPYAQSVQMLPFREM